MKDSFLKPILNMVRMWYIPLIIGILFLILSVVILSNPEMTLATLGLLFSLFFIFSGTAETLFAFSNRDTLTNWGWILVFGLATLLIGFFILGKTALSVEILIFYVGFLIFFRSVRNISLAWDIKKHGSQGWGGLMFWGILGVIAAFIILWQPAIGGLSLVYWVALAFLINGIFGIVFSLKLRKIHRHASEMLPRFKKRMQDIIEYLEEKKEDLEKRD